MDAMFLSFRLTSRIRTEYICIAYSVGIEHVLNTPDISVYSTSVTDRVLDRVPIVVRQSTEVDIISSVGYGVSSITDFIVWYGSDGSLEDGEELKGSWMGHSQY